jgi:hypothetical protein
MVVALKKLEQPEGMAWGIDGTNTVGENTEKSVSDANLEDLNTWRMRVAQYLAFCLDGGLVGSKLTIANILSNMAKDTCSKDAEAKFTEILTFLLHIRPRDMRVRWISEPLDSQFFHFGLLGNDRCVPCYFNDRVMQVLLEMGYISALMPAEEGEGMSSAYAKMLSCLLMADMATVNLKASICRQIVAAKDMNVGTSLCPGLMELLRGGNLFLKTYSCAALVNICQSQEVVKSTLMDNGIAGICLDLLRSRDDDLVLYTLMLLTHLSKSAHHRDDLSRTDLIPVLYEALTYSYGVIQIPQKRRIFTELCAVMGQMANDDENRVRMTAFSARCAKC